MKCGPICGEGDTGVYVTWNHNTGINFRPGRPPNQNTQALSALSSTRATNSRTATLSTCAVLSGLKISK